ncbi:MAG TPA: tellurium resistance protein TerC [Candidatus Eremiobacteraeota bacterium]|nr:MAG: Inner membrane protein alx [bacterium ADurb.Bin363]HPZ08760.1 tellurium resistance protein TerC [Candidatus Eremiobacteraeota bacterium]
MSFFYNEFHIFLGEITSFDGFDLLTILTLALLEGVLSVDNALVLAVMVKDLPAKARRKALTYGMWGAFIFRLLAVIFATFIIRWWYFKLVGGAYLLYISMKHMYMIGHGGDKKDEKEKKKKIMSFWYIVLLVELTDIVFSIDSITTAVAMTEKITIIWIGGILGIVCMRLLSNFFVNILERFPRTEDLAYQLVFFVGTKLLIESLKVPLHLDIEISHGIFWLMMAIILVIGGSLIYRDHLMSKRAGEETQQLCDDLLKAELTFEEMLEKEEKISTQLIKLLLRKRYLFINFHTNRLTLKKLTNEDDGTVVKAKL